MPDFIRDYVSWGAGPRASQYLILGAKARAVLHGRYYVSGEDIRAVAPPVLRHRIITNFNAEAEGIKPDDIVAQLVETIPVRSTPRRMAIADFGLPIASDAQSAIRIRNPKSNRCHHAAPPPARCSIRTRWPSSQGLELRARQIVEGYVAGMHRSPYHGFSVEFAEHREYVPGDDLRYVDWKVFGKTDKFYLKQYEEETNLICYLLLDTSESMRYQGPGAPLSKLEYAQCVAAALAYLVLQQQDSVGLATFDQEVRQLVRPSSSPSHLKQLLHVMEQTAAGAQDRAPARSSTTWPSGSHERGIVVILSDLFDDVEAMLAGLKHFRHRRHEVIVFHVLDPAELDFPFQQTTLFKGLEALAEVLTEPRSLRAAYQNEMQRSCKHVRTAAAPSRSITCTVRTDQPLDVVLTAFLSARKKRVK